MVSSVRLFDILALIVILAASFLIYSPHEQFEGPYLRPLEGGVVNGSLGHHPYPLHIDGWNHVSLAKTVVQREGLYHSNPQLPVHTSYQTHEWGFHLIVGLVSVLLGIPVLKLSVILPSLFFLLGALMWYVFLGRQLKRPLAALISIVFFALIPANANILGLWFFIPLTTLWFFVSSFGVLLFSGLSVTAKSVLATLLLLISFTVYPFATMIMLVLSLCVLGWHYRNWISTHWSKHRLATLGIGGGVLILLIALLFSGVLDMLIFEKGWTAVEHNFPVSYFAPWILVFIAASGVFLMWDDDLQWLSLFTGFFFVHGLVSFLTYHMFDFTVLLPFQRMVFIWQLFVGLAIGFAVEYLVRKLSDFYALESWKSTLVSVGAVVIVVGLLLAWQLPGYYAADPERFAIPSVTSDAYLQLVGTLPDSGGVVVLSEPLTSASIYPLTGHKVVSVLDGNLGGQNQRLYNRFLVSDCKTKSELLAEHDVDFIITDHYFDCPYIAEKAFVDGLFLYRTV